MINYSYTKYLQWHHKYHWYFFVCVVRTYSSAEEMNQNECECVRIAVRNSLIIRKFT